MKDIGKATKIMTIKQAKRIPYESPEGSWQTKVPLGRVLPKGIHSCPIVKDKHLAVAIVK